MTQHLKQRLILGGLALTLALLPGQHIARAQEAPPMAEAEAPRPPLPPQSFPSPEAGFAALAEAIAGHDERRLLRVLGQRAIALVRSGDPVADRAARDRFTAAYAAKHEILRSAPGRATLQIGTDDWPLPIPMVQRGQAWRFDAREGAQELLDRRIGRNELDTIAALRTLVEVQDEYARTAGRQGALRSYARRFFSTPGQRDGLYWATDEGEAPSPLGPLAAAASEGGYARRGPGEAPRPFHGYLFRMLEGQGPAARGGEMDYVVNGRMIGGFAVLAIPAQYGVSGIQSFLVSHQGQVYQANLGPQTAQIARGITRFDPGPGWVVVPE
ncbi:DUF2950 domain-containing protein [Sediminicoccus sp. KRV36]|uniref:DUF2950 domain-containing protein n=1 Tax=Sediminicoccus sp. KRV36 TaxID=3133721 RepID=UPI00200C6465|nr:DUF2950 domain-containing protein [Sediminicoccus rosea]UPY36514.1 DUF2950 domain-containing protein [Sediminicoccus rosea]